MTEEDFLRRFDKHLEIGTDYLARGSELLARGNVLHERSNDLMGDNKVAIAELGRAMQDVGIELRQMSERGERVAREMVAAMQDLGAESREMVAAMQDLGAESRAQQQALFVVIDRLTGDGPTPGGA